MAVAIVAIVAMFLAFLACGLPQAPGSHVESVILYVDPPPVIDPNMPLPDRKP